MGVIICSLLGLALSSGCSPPQKMNAARECYLMSERCTPCCVFDLPLTLIVSATSFIAGFRF